MYAILKTGGKQYKVSEGDVIYVEKLGVEDGATVTFDEVLAVGEGDKLTVGAPYVSGAAVTGTVEKTGKGKKIRRRNSLRRANDSIFRKKNPPCGFVLQAKRYVHSQTSSGILF